MNSVALILWKMVYRILCRRAARQILKGRMIDLQQPEKGRWRESDVQCFLDQTWARTGALLPLAVLDELPTYGNRHNVYLAVIKTAAYQVLLERGTAPDYAMTLVADLGWKIYVRMLTIVSLPFRITIRDPGRRMEKILRALIVFPFSAPGAPGYEVKIWTEGSNTHTHWIHCPPQSFVRHLIEVNGNQGELEAFYTSWCRYDWPIADVLANDGQQGHYSRPNTLSKGDSICDMCWRGYANVGREPGEL